MKKFSTKKIARIGVIASIYAVLCLVAMPISSGAIQIRVSEALTILPLFIPESIISLFVGCLIANIITGCFILDVILGSLVTLVASFMTYLVGKAIKKGWLKIAIGGLFPVLLNAFLLPVIWYFTYGKLEYMYLIQVAFLLIGQTISVYLFGGILYTSFRKIKIKEEKKSDES